MSTKDEFLPFPETVARLTRAFQIERGLVRALGVWLAGVPYWDAKFALGEHLWVHAQHAGQLLKRLHELKETAAERQEAGPIDALLRALIGAPSGDDFLTGVYACAMPRLAELFAGWGERTDPVMDPLSRQSFQEAAASLREQAAWAADYKPRYSPGRIISYAAFTSRIENVFDSLDFEAATWRSQAPEEAAGSATEFAGFATPCRDACFRTAYYNEVARRSGDSFAERRRAIFYNHTQEMQFAESLGAILYDMPEMPWAFHFDLARHCVDEIKHTRMGCTRLEQLGEDLRQFPMLLQNYSLRAKLDPVERFCMMTLVIEAASFEKKRANVKMFQDAGDEISARYESYDIRDEMMHVNFGHTWVPIMLRVTQDTRSVTDLTTHCRDILEDALKDERRAG